MDLYITTVTQSLIAKAGEMREQERWRGGLPWRSRQKAEMLAGDRIIGIEAERRFKTPASLFRPPTSPIKIPQVAVGLVVWWWRRSSHAWVGRVSMNSPAAVLDKTTLSMQFMTLLASAFP